MTDPVAEKPAARLELAASDVFNETVIDRLPLGVVVLDRDGYVVKYNAFEESRARRDRRQVIGRRFFDDVARCTDVAEIRGRFENGIAANALDAEVEFSFELPFLPRPRDVRIVLRSFELRQQPFGILLIEDVDARRALEREREGLMRVLAHDLNNPLQAILGYARLLETGAFGPIGDESQLRALRSISESSNRMRERLEGSLAELGGRDRQRSQVNLHALVLSAIGNLLPSLGDAGPRIVYDGEVRREVEFPHRAVALKGNVEQLASLVDNLLSNAAKYAASEVRVRLEERDGAVILEVEDDGRGIPAGEHGRIFERGYQSPGSLPGQGLGLYSVRRTVEAHGGRVEVDPALGAGARFRVELPT